MADEIISLVISIIFAISASFALIFAGKRLWQAPYLLHAVISAVILTFIFLWSTIYLTLTGQPFQLLVNFSMIPLDFVFFFLYLYFEALATVRPPPKRIVPVIFLSIFNLTFNGLNTLYQFTNANLLPLFATLTYFYGMLIFAFGVSVFRRTYTIYRKTAIKIDLGTFTTALASTILFQMAGICTYYFEWAVQLFWVGDVIFIGAMGLMVLNSMINGGYLYYIPHPIQAILVLNEGGVLVYEQTFESGVQKLQKGPDLISRALTAFSSFFKEVLGTDTKFTHINAEKFDFYFQDLPDNVGTLVIVASSANLILLKSMRKLAQSLPRDLLNAIENFHGKMLFTEFDNLIKGYFPYLNPIPRMK